MAGAQQEQEYFVQLDGREWPVSQLRPDLSSYKTVPARTRIASVSYGEVINKMMARGSGQPTQTGEMLPMAGAIVTNQHYGRMPAVSPAHAVVLEVFPKVEGRRPKMMQQVAEFAERYAAAVRDKKFPLIVVPDVAKPGERPEDNGHVAAFFAGLVVRALKPNALLLTASYAGPSRESYLLSSSNDFVGDELAMAASQGQSAMANRTILESGEPEWHHVAPQLLRFTKQFAGFEAKRVGKGWRASDYLWKERDPRNKGESQVFSPYHMVMLSDYPSTSSSIKMKWVETMIDLFHPGQDYENDPAHQVNALRHWLAESANSLMSGSPVAAPVVLPPRPAKTPEQAAMHAGEPVLVLRQKVG